MTKENIVKHSGTLDLTKVDPRTNGQIMADAKLQNIKNATTFEEIKQARHELVKFLQKHRTKFKSSYFQRLREANKVAEQKLIDRKLQIQLADTSKIYQTSLEERSGDTDDFKRRQHVLKVYLQTMLLGIEGKPFNPDNEFNYNQLTIAQAAAMNLRLHIEFDSQETLDAYQDYLVGSNFKEQIEYRGSEIALKGNKLVYPRTSTHILKLPDNDGEPLKEGKSQLAGIIGWFKAMWHSLTNGFYDRNRPTGNKGINLRFRGAGNLNFSGRTVGSIDGMDGTLLNNVTIDEKKNVFALSLSIEDCQPGKENQFRKAHSNLGDASVFSATGFTKKAPKKLNFFDKVLLFFKGPKDFIQKKHEKENEALLKEWRELSIIPPEKRSGFKVSRKITLADVQKLRDTAFRLELLNQKIKDNLIELEPDVDLNSEKSNLDQVHGEIKSLIQQKSEPMAGRLGDNRHIICATPRQIEANPSSILEQQIEPTIGKRL